MMNRRIERLILATLAFVIMLPFAAFAQSSFAGLVRDESGGVLPGVTVEAASPALIEKVRVATTDNSIATLAPALKATNPDVGGSYMTNAVMMRGHGVPSSQTALLIDGFIANLYAGGLATPYFNEAVGAEISISTSANPAETA